MAMLVLAIGAAEIPAAMAAGLYTESFDTGYAGWSPTNNISTAMVWTNGYARFRFNASGAPPLGYEAGLISSPTSSAGFFAGDFFVAAEPMVGCDVYFEDIVCPSLYIQLVTSSTNEVRAVYATSGLASQTWYRLMAPLAREFIPGASVGSVASNVYSVRVGVGRPNMSITETAAFRLDNIFLGSVPAAQSMGLSSGEPVIVWAPLQSGTTYLVQSSTNLLADWTTATSFVADGASGATTNSVAPGAFFQRIRAAVLAPR